MVKSTWLSSALFLLCKDVLILLNKVWNFLACVTCVNLGRANEDSRQRGWEYGTPDGHDSVSLIKLLLIFVGSFTSMIF